MTVFADVYNKTALPLTTAPSLKNDLEVKNTVDINSGSAINAIRNVNINAESGTEVITESAFAEDDDKRREIISQRKRKRQSDRQGIERPASLHAWFRRIHVA